MTRISCVVVALLAIFVFAGDLEAQCGSSGGRGGLFSGIRSRMQERRAARFGDSAAACGQPAAAACGQSQTSSQLIVSPDGRFVWDGLQWVAVAAPVQQLPQQLPKTSPTSGLDDLAQALSALQAQVQRLDARITNLESR